MKFKIVNANCKKALPKIPENKVHAIVTDPPYELSFMNKKWDSSGIAYDVEMWKECLRVLKPGGHLLCFGGTRTFHRITCAIEDAGFQIRDCLMWVYGSGFPKSHNIGKKVPEFEGWGTALKPAWEPIVLARKPFKGTVAKNVLEHGTAGLNIDACRIQGRERTNYGLKNSKKNTYGNPTENVDFDSTKGRWPANFMHDGSNEVIENFPDVKGGTWNTTKGARHFNNDGKPTGYKTNKTDSTIASAARFFYCSKASKKEKGKDNKHPTVKPINLIEYLVKLITPPGGIVLDPFMGSGTTGVACMNLDFRFVGIEMEKEYCEIAKKRIGEAKS